MSWPAHGRVRPRFLSFRAPPQPTPPREPNGQKPRLRPGPRPAAGYQRGSRMPSGPEVTRITSASTAAALPGREKGVGALGLQVGSGFCSGFLDARVDAERRWPLQGRRARGRAPGGARGARCSAAAPGPSRGNPGGFAPKGAGALGAAPPPARSPFPGPCTAPGVGTGGSPTRR